MTVPGLALFYGGLVRTKNMLSMCMQVFATMSLIMLLWVIYGYSLAFTNGGALNDYVGGFSKAFLSGVDYSSIAATFSNGVYIPEYIFICFQMTFAAITPALIVGAFAERIKFSARAAVHGALGDVHLLPDGPHGLVLGRSGLPSATLQAVAEAAGDAKIAAQAALDGVLADAGLIFNWGALDFAGGTVVHINAGIAGLVAASFSASASAMARKPCRRTR